MSPTDSALAIFIFIQVAGACPDVPEVKGFGTWLLKWAHDAMQAIARNKDRLK